LRMLSASWCDNGECRYSILNLLRIAFLPERSALVTLRGRTFLGNRKYKSLLLFAGRA
jgi:hypothetical protein